MCRTPSKSQRRQCITEVFRNSWFYFSKSEITQKRIYICTTNRKTATTAQIRKNILLNHQPSQLLQFKKTYFAFTVLLFLVEILIALFIHDQLIRPYFGDVLVVILIYCFIKSFFSLSVWTTAIIVFCFSFCVEFSQHLNLISKLGLENSGIAKAVLGNSFSYLDLFAYVTGIFCVIIIEKIYFKNPN